MMRKVLGLNVSLGLFGFPVNVYLGCEGVGEGISFRQLHKACSHPINLVKRCAQCEQDLTMADVVKGYPHNGGFVTFTDEELKACRPEAAGTITILGYVPSNALDSAYMDGTLWYLTPDPGKNKKADDTTFVTWREALKGRWALGKVVLYGRERIVGIRAQENLLTMQALRTHAEVRSIFDVPGYEKVGHVPQPDHLALMEQLMVQRTIQFDDVVLESDAYVDAVKAMIQARIDGAPLPPAAPETPTQPPVDLAAMLKASLAATKVA